MKYWIFIFSLLTSLASSGQSVPALTNYQGRLTDVNGNAAPDGTGYEIELRLWPTATGGTSPIWGTRFSGVAVKGGALNLILGGGGTAIAGAQTTDLKTAFANTSVFLALTVTKGATGTPIANPSEILPRQQWMTAPFAFRAEIAGGTLPGAVTGTMIAVGGVSTANLADSAVTNSKIAVGAVNSSNTAAQSLDPDRLNQIYAQYFHEMPSGTDVGSNAGWSRRSLTGGTNSVDGSITRTDSTITLKPGTYFVEAQAFVILVNSHNLIVRDVTAAPTGGPTNSEALIKGLGGITPQIGSGRDDPINSSIGSNTSVCSGYLTVTGADEKIELWQFAATSNVRNGFGLGVSGGGLPYRPVSLRIIRIN